MPLPLPAEGERWHLHGSPPCTAVSLANQVRDEDKRDHACDLVQWFLKFAMDSHCTSWSMEQVAAPVILRACEELKKPGSPYRHRFEYMARDLSEIGVPQRRRRLIAGPPKLIAHFKRLPTKRLGIRDYIAEPRGTHVRGSSLWSCPRRAPTCIEGPQKKWIYKLYGDDDACRPLNMPGPTITATRGMNWATPGTGTKLVEMSIQESAILQTFPATYRFPAIRRRAIRGIGNALPPLVMRKLLSPASTRPASPSLRRRPGPIGPVG